MGRKITDYEIIPPGKIKGFRLYVNRISPWWIVFVVLLMLRAFV